MAEENIDNTVGGTGLFNTKIPGLSDAADIQAALRLYHYGTYTYDGANTNPAILPVPSMAKHLQTLVDADAAEVVNRNAAIATHNADTTDVHGIPNTANLATQAFVTTAVTNAINGATGGYPDLAGNGIDWNSVDLRFDLEPQLLNNNTVITKTSGFTLDPVDVNKTILLSASSPMTLTIPSNSSVEIPIGYKYNLVEIGLGKTTFSASSGVIINSKNSQLFIDSRYGNATLLKIGTDSWVAYGDIYEGSSAQIFYNVTYNCMGSTNCPPNTTYTTSYTIPSNIPDSMISIDGNFLGYNLVSDNPSCILPAGYPNISATAVANGYTISGGCVGNLSLSPVFENIAAPVPVTPTPVTPTPVTPTPVTPTPVTPTPVTPTPVTPTPVTPTPVTPTPTPPCNPDWSLIPESQCAACGLVWSPTFGECIQVNPTPTPVTPTPVTPTPVTPTPVTPTPVTPTPVTPVPGPNCNDVNTLGSGDCAACGLVWSPEFNECIQTSPTPVAPTPVAPTPVAPTPVAPTPVAPTPVAPTPVAPTPVAPTPTQCPAGYTWYPEFGECIQNEAPAPTPVAPTPVAPTPVAPTPVAPTPVAPAPLPPTPVAPTPVAPTPVAPTPVAPTPTQCPAGYTWYPQYGECIQNEAPAPTPVAPTPVAPTPVAPTPPAFGAFGAFGAFSAFGAFGAYVSPTPPEAPTPVAPTPEPPAPAPSPADPGDGDPV